MHVGWLIPYVCDAWGVLGAAPGPHCGWGARLPQCGQQVSEPRAQRLAQDTHGMQMECWQAEKRRPRPIPNMRRDTPFPRLGRAWQRELQTPTHNHRPADSGCHVGMTVRHVSLVKISL